MVSLAVGRSQDDKAGNSISRIESNESFSDFVSSRLGKGTTLRHAHLADPEQRQARNNGSKFTCSFRRNTMFLEKCRRRMVSKVEWHRVAIIWNLGARQTRAPWI